MKSAKKAVKKAAVARKKAAAKKAGRVVRKAVARPKVAAVAAANGDAKVDARSALREEYTIEAKNFGPIAEAKLTLKPLTVLIGPSNTGKTHMAMLACLMLRKQVDFFNLVDRQMPMFFRADAGKQNVRDTAAGIIAAIDAGGWSLSASNFPKELQQSMHRRADKIYGSIWRKMSSGNIPFHEELSSWCGAESTADLVAGFPPKKPLICKFTARTADTATSWGKISISPKGAVSTQSGLLDFSVPTYVPPGLKVKWMDELRRVSDGSSELTSGEQVVQVERALFRAFRTSFQLRRSASLKARFFPASRGGLMQARNAIAIAMLKTIGRGGLETIPGIPALPPMSAEFLSDMVEMTTQFHRGFYPTVGRRDDIRAQKIAKKMERDLLGGEIAVEKGNGGVPSEFQSPRVVFKPDGISTALTMEQSSSMVEELSPLILCLKKRARSGDTLFIEEPEAHLHPSAQTQMAEFLAAMVRAEIRVVITTHSDWILPSIANIVRRGELGEKGEKAALTKEEVGVWLFERGKSGGSTTRELKFDALAGSGNRGYIPDNLRDLSDNLHNDTADLLDEMDEMRREAETVKAE